MKDSSEVTFATELLHVTVSSLRGEKQEHLIGIMNTDGQSADRAGRTLQPSRTMADSLSNDMKHILGYGVQSRPAAQNRSFSRSSSTASSKQAKVKRLDSLERINLFIDVSSMEEDDLIRFFTMTFSSPATCSTELPNLEWVKPNYRQVQSWIQSHANSHAGESCKELPRGVKMISPSSSSSLLVELQVSQITEGEKTGAPPTPRPTCTWISSFDSFLHSKAKCRGMGYPSPRIRQTCSLTTYFSGFMIE
ncbi:unnamed protein product [Effrenium voratum]|nr:unnamed protein product [Effrenium voratum]